MEWEGSKENVRPLRQGRGGAALESALDTTTQPAATKQAERAERRRSLLRDIREYTGSDPLQPWYSYVKWAVQEFPTASGGERSEAFVALEECARKFQTDPRYTNDHRYVKIWVQYADHSQDQLIVMEAMHAAGIGAEDPLFYGSYATTAELKHKFKLADKILREGLKRVPEEKRPEAEHYLKSFNSRMKLRVIRKQQAQVAEGPPPREQEVEQRRHQPATDENGMRTFGAPAAHALTLPPQPRPDHIPAGNRPGASAASIAAINALPVDRRVTELQVFDEEEVGAGDAVALGGGAETGRTGTGAPLVPETERMKENSQLPSKWNEGPLMAPGHRRAGAARPVSRTEAPGAANPTPDASLEVYEDEEAAEATRLRNAAKKAAEQDKPQGLRLRLDGLPAATTSAAVPGTRATLHRLLNSDDPEDEAHPAGTREADRGGLEGREQAQEDSLRAEGGGAPGLGPAGNAAPAPEGLPTLRGVKSVERETLQGGGTVQGGTMQGDSMQGGPVEGGTVQGAPKLEGPVQGAPVPRDPAKSQERELSFEELRCQLYMERASAQGHDVSWAQEAVEPVGVTPAQVGGGNGTEQGPPEKGEHTGGAMGGRTEEEGEGATGRQGAAAPRPDQATGDTASLSLPTARAQQREAAPAAESLFVFEDEAVPAEGQPQSHAAQGQQPQGATAHLGEQQADAAGHQAAAPEEASVSVGGLPEAQAALAEAQTGPVTSQAGGVQGQAGPVDSHAGPAGSQAGVAREGKQGAADESDLTRSFKLAAGFAWGQGGSGEDSDEEEEGAEGGEEGGSSPGVSFLDPTIHTKEAMQDILGFFANPLSCEKPAKPGRTGHSPSLSIEEGGGGPGEPTSANTRGAVNEPPLLPSSRPDSSSGASASSSESQSTQATKGREGSGSNGATQARPFSTLPALEQPGACPSAGEPGKGKADSASEELFVYEDDAEEEGAGGRTGDPVALGEVVALERTAGAAGAASNAGFEVFDDSQEDETRTIASQTAGTVTLDPAVGSKQSSGPAPDTLFEVFDDSQEDETSTTALPTTSQAAGTATLVPALSLKQSAGPASFTDFEVFDDSQEDETSTIAHPTTNQAAGTSTLVPILGSKQKAGSAPLGDFEVFDDSLEDPLPTAVCPTTNYASGASTEDQSAGEGVGPESTSPAGFSLLEDLTADLTDFTGSVQAALWASSNPHPLGVFQPPPVTGPQGTSAPLRSTHAPPPPSASGPAHLLEQGIKDGPVQEGPVQAEDPSLRAVMARLLEQLSPALPDYEGFHEHPSGLDTAALKRLARTKGQKASAQAPVRLNLGDREFDVTAMVGEGAYAQVYRAHEAAGGAAAEEGGSTHGTSTVASALKVSQHRVISAWEFVIARQIQSRVPAADQRSLFVTIPFCDRFQDACVLTCPFAGDATLQDAINVYRTSRLSSGVRGLPDILCAYFGSELLHAIAALHSAGILHGDIKPDNLLLNLGALCSRAQQDPAAAHSKELFLRREGAWGNRGVCLIDYGRSADLTLFPPNTRFLAQSGTDAFRCPAMLDGQPWRFEADLFAAAGTLHCLVYGDYMPMDSLPPFMATNAATHRPRFQHKRSWAGTPWPAVIEVLLGVDKTGAPRAQSHEALVSVTQELDAMVSAQLPQLVTELRNLHRELGARRKE